MRDQPLKVLFLTRYPVEGASSRYRVFQYVHHLEALNVNCTVQSFMDRKMYFMSLKPGGTFKKIWATIKAVGARLSTLSKWRQYDIIYMQRELFPFGPPIVERWLKKRGAVLFFDYDDALFIKKPSRYNPIATMLRSPTKTRDLFRLVDCTVAGNNWLRDTAREEGGRAETIDVAEDTARIKMHAPHTNEKPVTIGWLGSPSTSKYLRIIAEPLKRVAARHPNVQWEVMGGGDFEMEGVPWTLHDWSLESELAALARFDIGLMPLPMQDWSKGKSGGKARTYMAAGIVPVVAGIGYNLELVKDGETGFLCVKDEDWEKTLDMLITDAEQRDRIAKAARAEVEERFSQSKQASKLAALFHETLAFKNKEGGNG